jgi:hypothetical protein
MAGMNDRIKDLQRRIEALQERFPAHSIPPALMAELDELEAQLAEALGKADDQDQATQKTQ